MYTKCSKNVIFTSLPADPESTSADPDISHSTSLSTDPLFFTVQMDTSSFNLHLSIAHRKSKQSCTQHPISNYVSYDRLIPLSRQFAMFALSVSIPILSEALMYSEWKHVMDDEIDALFSH